MQSSNKPLLEDSNLTSANEPVTVPTNPTIGLLAGAPRRKTGLSEPEQSIRPPKFSRIATQEIEAKKSELQSKLESAPSLPLCTRHRADLSDYHPGGPWARKVILCLDGGGIKGYSSLLVLKRLVSLIEEFELGMRRSTLPHERVKYHDPHASSEDCAWNPQPSLPPPTALVPEDDEAIFASVCATLRNPQSNRFKLHHYFDYIAGTSTGGLSAIMLGRLEMSVQAALDQYDLVGREVFGRPRYIHSKLGVANYLRPKYSSRRMEETLVTIIRNGLREESRLRKASELEQRQYAAKALFQSDSDRCRALVLAYGPSGQNKYVKHTYIFRTYDHPHPSPWAPKNRKTQHLNPGNATAHEIWKVARATSAAPRYFAPISFADRTFRDGAIGANNPSKVTLDEVLQMHRYPPKMILSIGTGLQAKKPNPQKHRKLPKAKGWRNLAKLITQLITQSEETAIAVEEACEHEGIEYCRANVPGVGDIRLDNWQPSASGQDTKENILRRTEEYLSQRDVHLRLVQVARDLVNLRRTRAETERWETFARKFLYFCPEPSCHHLKATQTFPTRNHLRDHGIYEHSYIINVNVTVPEECRHVCLFDRCGHDAIYVFANQLDFEQHLTEDHGIRHPEFMTPERMEAWLDLGRMTQEDALRRQDSSDLATQAEKMNVSSPGSGKSKSPHHRTQSNQSSSGLKPPRMIIEPEGSSISSSLAKSTRSQEGDNQPSSSHRSNTPTPSTVPSHRNTVHEKDIFIEHTADHRAESTAETAARHSKGRKMWQFPISIRKPWISDRGVD